MAATPPPRIRLEMTLRELIAGAGLDLSSFWRPGGDPLATLSPTELSVQIADLAYRSDSVSPGALFFCVPGFTSDGHDFAPDAVARGAVALVCERPLSLGVPEFLVESVRETMPVLAASFYGDPTAEL